MNIMLIHGQGRTSLAMFLLGWRLKRQQFRVHYFGYVCWRESFDHITDRFVNTIHHRFRQQPYAIVAHSLGGIITRASLPRLAGTPPQHLVMLAPPNRPPRMAKKMRANPIYRWHTGDCGRKLADETFYRQLPRPPIPTTIIAGTAGPKGRLLFFRHEVNDGVLAVAETVLGEGIEVILVPAWHPFIMNSKRVAGIISELLGNAATTPECGRSSD